MCILIPLSALLLFFVWLTTKILIRAPKPSVKNIFFASLASLLIATSVSGYMLAAYTHIGVHKYHFGSDIPDGLPVAIFWRDPVEKTHKSTTIFYSQLKDKKTEYGQITFLCPKEIAPSTIEPFSSQFFKKPNAIITTSGEDFQEWKISLFWETYFNQISRSEYRAYKDKIVPHSSQDVNSINALISALVYILIFTLSALMLLDIFRRLIHARKANL